MGDLNIQLFDINYVKNKQILGRAPFKDRSNIKMTTNQTSRNQKSRRFADKNDSIRTTNQVNNISIVLESCFSADPDINNKKVEFDCNQMDDFGIRISKNRNRHKKCDFKNLHEDGSSCFGLNSKCVKFIQKEFNVILHPLDLTNIKKKTVHDIDRTSLNREENNPIGKNDSNKLLFVKLNENIKTQITDVETGNCKTNALVVQTNNNMETSGIHKNIANNKDSYKTVTSNEKTSTTEHISIFPENNINLTITPPISKRLRHCERKNYLETSETLINDTNRLSKCVNDKVPIYKQIVVKENEQKRDPYELDLSDLEDNTSRKARTKRQNDSEKFDRTMYEIIKKMEKKTNRAKRVKIARNPNTYDDNIKSILQRVMQKKMQNNKIGKDNAGVCMNKKQFVELETRVGFTTEINSQIPEVMYQNKDYATKKSLGPEVGPKKKKICEEFSNNEYEFCRSSIRCDTDKQSITADSPLLCSNYNDETDNLFGFSEAIDTIHPGKDNRINVISNIALNPSVSFLNPVTQSTIERHSDKSPWRMDLKKNSNYNLLYKKNALPSLKQDLVIDHSLAESFRECLSKTNSIIKTPQKTHIQRTILDYVDNSEISSNKENILENCIGHSLFDSQEFEICSTEKPSSKNREVLGVIHDNNSKNTCAFSTPLRENRIYSMPSPNISLIENGSNIVPNSEIILEGNESFFGFISENSNDMQELPDVPKDGQPFRISIGAIKKYKRRIIDDYETGEKVDQTEDFQMADDVADNSIGEVNIFDDVEPQLLLTEDAPIQYHRKARRRQRLASVTSESSEDEKPKKKKKNAMTKAEEEEFEKWAAQFNAMCSEIEKHTLEVE